MKKKNAVMLADTRPALVGTILLQLQKTNPHLYDEAIIYYVDQISDTDRALMASLMPCRFVEYKPPLPNELFEKARFKRFSILMFCRYEMFAYLNEYETITWLDTDILIQNDLSEMIELAKSTGAAFIREDPTNKTAETVDYMRTCFTQDIHSFKMDEYLYCSGTIVLTDQIFTKQGIDGEQCKKWCYQKTIEWANILDLPDQGVLNAAIQQFSIEVSLLNGKKYCCYPAIGRNCKDATIIHAWGNNKFWNDWYLYVNYEDWGRYYNDWRHLGGSTLEYEIQPSASVIIPCYKPNLTFMKQCLNSLMNQCQDGWERYSDFEIIIVSEPVEQEEKKAIEALVNSYHDNRIYLKINTKRLGIAASLNNGIKCARGQYIARMDADDLCEKARIFLQVNYLNDHKDITLCTSDFAYFGDMNERRTTFEGDMSYAWSIFTCPFDHPTIMFNKQFFIQNQLFYDENRDCVEDWELWRRAFKKGMKVGCIHKVLFYHRWINDTSAGQTSRTIYMMREMVRENFEELNVKILPEHLWMIGPWNGMISNVADIMLLQAYFDKALENNKKYKIYDQTCLKRAFQFRIEEARSGHMSGLSEKNGVSKYETNASVGSAMEFNIYKGKLGRVKQVVKKWLKQVLQPVYLPFRHRYEDRIIHIQKFGWVLEGHLLNCIAKLDFITMNQNLHLKCLMEKIDKMEDEIATLRLATSSMASWAREKTDKMEDEIATLRLAASSMASWQREKLDKIEDSIITLHSQLISQDHNLNEFVKKQSEELYARMRSDTENIRQEIHRHVDFTYRDIEALIRQNADALIWNMMFELKKNNVQKLVGASPLYDSAFYWNNRYGSITSAQHILSVLFPTLSHRSVVDFGCGTGTWLWVAKALGAEEVYGIDGDYVPRPLLLIDTQDFLPADLEKPVILDRRYDLAMSLEVAEHLSESAADTFIDSLCRSSNTILFSAAHPGQGGDGHINEQPRSFWIEKFMRHNFYLEEIKSLFINDMKIEPWYRENIMLFRQENDTPDE